MPDIAYVCLSDMHFGADNSVLTNLGATGYDVDPSKPTEVLERLCECLRYVIIRNSDGRRPTLILNGDIFEFALAMDNVAAMAFQRFIEIAFPRDPSQWLFDRQIIYIPGNHDHHLWEVDRETQYREFIQKRLNAGQYIPPPWHTTRLEKGYGVQSLFVETLIHKFDWLEGVSVRTSYPNLGLLERDGRSIAVFSHGHFTESIYSLMSTVADLIFPGRTREDTVYELEAENFAWIDFFWSTMGRSGGGVGKDVELIYDDMQNEKAFAKFVDSLARNLARQYGKGWFMRKLGGRALGIILRRILVGGSERATADKLLSDDGAGLRAYLQTPVANQLKIELCHGSTPKVASFIFGHTHKPFEEICRIGGLGAEATAVYNSGGWVVDSEQPQSLFGGAVILLDDELNIASLRMYNEAASAAQYRVRVANAWPTQFFEYVQSLVRPDEEPWRSFSAAAAAAVTRYTQRLASEIKRST